MKRIKRVELYNFKAFKRFSLILNEHNYIVGPNNAGKSTVISALKLCASLIRSASLKKADSYRKDPKKEKTVQCHITTCIKHGLVSENLRHDFNTEESRLYLKLENKSSLTVVWPADSDGNNESFFYYFENEEGLPLVSARAVKEKFPSIGIIPTLTPLENQETILTEEYVHSSRETRLASRHFRNHLHILKNNNTFDQFVELARVWSPEIEIDDLRARASDNGRELDLFYKEPGTRSEREIVWAGDGLQIWLQILLHYLHNKDKDALILDEPDVFLHSDLQKRITRLLQSNDIQSVMATHSSEVLAEAKQSDLVWVDKSKRNGIRTTKNSQLEFLCESLGTSFNIRLARALKSKIVLFVEGDDQKYLLKMAKKLGFKKIANEIGLAIIPIGGFDKKAYIEPFKWFLDGFLDHSIKVFALLDRDYRCDEEIAEIEKSMREIGIDIHIWNKKEIESYLISLDKISNATQLSKEIVKSIFDTVTEARRYNTLTQLQDSYARFHSSPQAHRTTLYAKFLPLFEASWKSESYRYDISPPKEILSALNQYLQDHKAKALTYESLIALTDRSNTPKEMLEQLQKIENAL